MRTPVSLNLRYVVAGPTHRLPIIARLLEKFKPSKTIIFLPTCASVDYFRHLYPGILPAAYRVVALHGKQPQAARERTLETFSHAVIPTVLLATDVAARGLDIPQVDLIIQEPPSDTKQFLHRCGRSGRAGMKGLAVTVLLPGKEESYIPFLSLRHVHVHPMTDITVNDTEASRIAEQIRKVVLNDRALHDKAQQAFVSFVRAYTKHTASAIFSITNLKDNWQELAGAWGLLKMPKMPENTGQTVQLPSVDWRTYGYLDMQREKARLQGQNHISAELTTQRQAKRPKNRRNLSWSGNLARTEERKVQREKRHVKKDFIRKQKMTEEESKKAEQLQLWIEDIKNKRP